MLSTTTSQNAGQSVREITLGQTIRETLAEEMRRDPHVFIMGEDVAEAGTAFKVLSGLVEELKRKLDLIAVTRRKDLALRAQDARRR